MSEGALQLALIVVKEEQLGERIVSILEGGFGYRCELILVRTRKDCDKVAQEFSSNSFDIVVGQQRMSPYSATDLLMDARERSPGRHCPVVCLADNISGEHRFILSGGASFEVVEPDYQNLRASIAKALYRVADFTADLQAARQRAYQHIDACANERAFHRLVRVIFQQLGYQGIRLPHGPWERGCDLVCWDVNRLGRKEHVGVQMKHGDVDDSSGQGSVAELLIQAFKALNSRVLVDDGGSYLDKFVVMASGIVKPSARSTLVEILQGIHHQRRVFFLDREDIADLMARSCQSLLARLDLGVE